MKAAATLACLMLASLMLACLTLAMAVSGRAQPASYPNLPLAITVAELDGRPVVDDAWLAERVALSNPIFAPSSVSFVVRERASMDASHARMENRRDRHALGALLVARSINVLVVASLRDVDDPSLMRQGVHWRSATFPGTHYVILSAASAPTTLAHELGHFFGNPHSAVTNNVMSYDRDGTVLPFFDAAQIRRIRAHARRFTRSGELVADAP